MKYKFLENELKYDGTQLHSLFGYENDLVGNSIVCFIGPAKVREHLVDCEDRLAGDYISSEKMLHFIIEIFDASLRETVAFQRLFISIIVDHLQRRASLEDMSIERKGDDIFINDKKFSVSIATKSLVSGLIHIGLNIEVGENCPVRATGFLDFDKDLDLASWSRFVMQNFAEEFDNIQQACYKVRSVQ
jgi:hypothetical protein